MKTGRKYGEKEKIQTLIKPLIFRTLRIYIFSFYAFLFFVSLADADLRIDLQRKDVERNGISIKLSPKEYNLLLYMVENAERVLSRVEIAEKVWNTHFDTGTNFIDVYINYLRKKIDRDFEPKLIHTKAGMGFILTDKI